MTDLEAIATRKGNILTLTLINKDVLEPKDFSVNLCGKLIDAQVLTAPDLLPHSTFVKEALPVQSDGDTLTLQLPACSAAIVQICCE